MNFNEISSATNWTPTHKCRAKKQHATTTLKTSDYSEKREDPIKTIQQVNGTQRETTTDGREKKPKKVKVST